MKAAIATLVLTLALGLSPSCRPHGRAHVGNAANAGNGASGPLSVSANPNYFQDATGAPLILNGSHTWNTIQDWGTDGVTEAIDYPAFVNFLVSHGHNFTLLWITELPKFCKLPTTHTPTDANPSPEITVSAFPWQRTGPGNATDGKPKFDFTKFEQSFFDRVRARVAALDAAKIYAGVYFFSGEWLLRFRCATDGYPFTGPNNVNGIDDGGGSGSMLMTAPNAVTAIQDAYVQKLIDTLNDLPNVLWLVSQESDPRTLWWQGHQIDHVRAYETGKPLQHPIGFGSMDSAPDTTLYNSNADFALPIARISPTKSCGTGKPPCKVNVNDSDHSYWEMWQETAERNRNYVWKNLTLGNQTVFMDPYVVDYPRENRNMCPGAKHGICNAVDTRWDNFRDNLGWALKYSRRLNLSRVVPQEALSTKGFCLAQTPAVGAEYLLYAPGGGTFFVDLSAMPKTRSLDVEWFNPSDGTVTKPGPMAAGSPIQSFTAPFKGDSVLYLVDTAGHDATSP